jgi:hypothetical protein
MGYIEGEARTRNGSGKVDVYMGVILRRDVYCYSIKSSRIDKKRRGEYGILERRAVNLEKAVKIYMNNPRQMLSANGNGVANDRKWGGNCGAPGTSYGGRALGKTRRTHRRVEVLGHTDVAERQPLVDILCHLSQSRLRRENGKRKRGNPRKGLERNHRILLLIAAPAATKMKFARPVSLWAIN